MLFIKLVFPDFDKTPGDWTHLNITDPVSSLSLLNHYIKLNTVEVMVVTASNTASKHESHVLSQVICCARVEVLVYTIEALQIKGNWLLLYSISVLIVTTSCLIYISPRGYRYQIGCGQHQVLYK